MAGGALFQVPPRRSSKPVKGWQRGLIQQRRRGEAVASVFSMADEVGWDRRFQRAALERDGGPAAQVTRVGAAGAAHTSRVPESASAASSSGKRVTWSANLEETDGAGIQKAGTGTQGGAGAAGAAAQGGAEAALAAAPNQDDMTSDGADRAAAGTEAGEMRIPGVVAGVVERPPAQGGGRTAPSVRHGVAFPAADVVVPPHRKTSRFRKEREAGRSAAPAPAPQPAAIDADLTYASGEADRMLEGMSEAEVKEAVDSVRANLPASLVETLARRGARKGAAAARRGPGPAGAAAAGAAGSDQGTERAADRRRRARGGAKSLFAQRRHAADAPTAASPAPSEPVPVVAPSKEKSHGEEGEEDEEAAARGAELVRWGVVKEGDLPRIRRLAAAPHLIEREEDLVAAAMVSDPLAAAKLAWTRPTEAAQSAAGEGAAAGGGSTRYDLSGRPVDEGAGEGNAAPQQRWLYQHEDEPERPGYTAEELEWLARARFPAQRAAALGALAGVWRGGGGSLAPVPLSLTLSALADRAGLTAWTAAADALDAAVLASAAGQRWLEGEAVADCPYGLDMPADPDVAASERAAAAEGGGGDEGGGPATPESQLSRALQAATRVHVEGVSHALEVLCTSAPRAAASVLRALACLCALSRPVCATFGARGGKVTPLFAAAIGVVAQPWLVFGAGESVPDTGAGSGGQASPAVLCEALRLCRVLAQDDGAVADLLLQRGTLDYAQGVAALQEGSSAVSHAAVSGVQREALRLLRVCAASGVVPSSPSALARFVCPHAWSATAATAPAALALLATVAGLPPPGQGAGGQDGAAAAAAAEWEDGVEGIVSDCIEQVRALCGGEGTVEAQRGAHLGGLLAVIGAYHLARERVGVPPAECGARVRSASDVMSEEAAYSLVHGVLVEVAGAPAVRACLAEESDDNDESASRAALLLGIARTAAAAARARPSAWVDTSGAPAAAAALRLVDSVRQAAVGALRRCTGPGMHARRRCLVHAAACAVQVRDCVAPEAAAARAAAAVSLLPALGPGDEGLTERMARRHLLAREVVTGFTSGAGGASSADAAAASVQTWELCLGIARRPALGGSSSGSGSGSGGPRTATTHRLCPPGLVPAEAGLHVARSIVGGKRSKEGVSTLPLPPCAPVLPLVVVADRLGACTAAEDADELAAMLSTLLHAARGLVAAVVGEGGDGDEAAATTAAAAVVAAAHAGVAACAAIGARAELSAAHAALCTEAERSARRAGGDAGVAAHVVRVLGSARAAGELVDGAVEAMGEAAVPDAASRTAALMLLPHLSGAALSGRCWRQLAQSRAVRVLEQDPCAAALVGGQAVAPEAVVERARRGLDRDAVALAEAWLGACTVPVFAAMVEEDSPLAEATLRGVASLAYGPGATQGRRRQVETRLAATEACMRSAFCTAVEGAVGEAAAASAKAAIGAK